MSDREDQDAPGRLPVLATAAIMTAAVVDFAAILSAVGPATRTAVVVVATVGVLVAAYRLGSVEQVTAKAVIGHVVAVLTLALGVGGVLAALPGRSIRPASVALATGIIAFVAFPAATLMLLRRLVRAIPVRFGDVLTGLVVAVSVSVVLGGIIGAWASPRRSAAPDAAAGADDPWALGQKVYASRCAACHGPRGEGGVGPKLRGGEVKLTFPNEGDHEAWVRNGSVSVAGKYYGDPNRPGGQQGPALGSMPGFGMLLSDEEIKAVVAFERERLR